MKYYIGSSEKPDRRLLQHNSGQTKSTKYGIPWKIVYQQACRSTIEARQIEYKLKQMKSRKLLDRIVAEQVIKIGV